MHQGEWWRIFTVALVHEGFLHIFFNMLLLWIVGQLLEPGSGPVRFALIYVVSVDCRIRGGAPRAAARSVGGRVGRCVRRGGRRDAS